MSKRTPKEPAFIRALRILDENRTGLLPEQFYALMWPEAQESGRTIGGRSLNSGCSKGGPSRDQCAANWLLGRVAAKYPESVRRYDYLDADRMRAGRWFITSTGRAVLMWAIVPLKDGG